MNTKNTHQPQCVGFIMDGNRRWAKAQGLDTIEGHAKGYQVMQDLVGVVYKTKIPHMISYAFSTENWNRSEKEVNYLMKLLGQGIRDLSEKSKDDTRRINFHIVGERSRLPKDLQRAVEELESQRFEDPELTVWVAVSYGSRAEIIEATNRCIKKRKPVDEKTFAEELWTAGMPDPDMVVRTSGERRLSNFLLWQVAYSELFFTDTLWPDFGEDEFQSMLEEYAGRQRRKGK